MAEKELKDNKNGEKAEKVTLSKQEYEALRANAAKAEEFYEKYIRAQADFDNMRKRVEKERVDLLMFANEGLLMEFLPIADNLEIAEKHIKEAKDFKAVQEGVDMIQAEIRRFLKDLGVERIKTVGEKFDPHMHEAVETEESKDKADGLIVAELKPGYKLNGKLLRPASVKIVKKKQT